MSDRLYLYDTTLRDGAQTQGVDFSHADKQRIAAMLDALGVDWIEGGWPGANPVDDAFFREKPALKRARFAAFGMTRRSGRSAANDPGLAPLLNAPVDGITLVGKASRRHAEVALGVEADENLAMIEDSFRAASGRVDDAMYDAEHFFDGLLEDEGFALACLEAALRGGAAWIVLCDTNGGMLPRQVAKGTEKVRLRFPEARIGVHAHDDSGTAIANSLAAIDAGARQVQGTLNGLGERCGNANLATLIPTLALKTGYEIGVDPDRLARLTEISRAFDEQLNREPLAQNPYVGRNAFAHKGGLHASAVVKDPSFYEHVRPEQVGAERAVLVSSQAGRSNLMQRLAKFDLPRPPTDDEVGELLRRVKERESEGYAYEGAGASFEMMVRRAIGAAPDYFDLKSFRVIDERRFNAIGELITLSEATVKVDVAGENHNAVADGTGPVDALDQALREVLSRIYPSLQEMRLVDYKVRILDPEAATAAVTRVIIESEDVKSQARWQTVGVSANIIDASYEALFDALLYKLVKDGVRPAH